LWRGKEKRKLRFFENMQMTVSLPLLRRGGGKCCGNDDSEDDDKFCDVFAIDS
jgi:hypothetical protein